MSKDPRSSKEGQDGELQGFRIYGKDGVSMRCISRRGLERRDRLMRQRHGTGNRVNREEPNDSAARALEELLRLGKEATHAKQQEQKALRESDFEMTVIVNVMGIFFLASGLAIFVVGTWEQLASGETEDLFAMWMVAGFATAIGAFIMWSQLMVVFRLLQTGGRRVWATGRALTNSILASFRAMDAPQSKAADANKPLPRGDRDAASVVVEQPAYQLHEFKPGSDGIDLHTEMTTQSSLQQAADGPSKGFAITPLIGVLVAILLLAAYKLAESQGIAPQSHLSRLHETTVPTGGPGQWGGSSHGRVGSDREPAEGESRFDERRLSRPGFGGTPPAYQDAVALEDLPEAWQRALQDVPENLKEGIQMGLRGDADGMFQFLSSVAVAGEHGAYLPLAVCYLVGIGTDPDPVMAVPFLQHQSEEGCLRSREILAAIDEADRDAARQISTGETEMRAIEVRRPRIINYGPTDPSP